MKQFTYLIALACLLAGAPSLLAQNFNLQLRGTLEYPGQTLANICGYAQNGKEYALVGASQGLSIVDVTNPDNPVEIVQIPGPNNLWKEIKVYKHYAYVTSEGGGGVQIVDMSKLPSPALDYHNYTGTGEIDGQLNTIHALHIDVTKGFLYTYGGGFSSARVHDLNADPYNPVYVGKFEQLGYIHDGYADNDTLYSCHIYAGQLAIVDMRDKLNPVLLGTVETPGRFTHNAWLTDDHKHILTTDETTPSFLTSYDISDPTDIKELDRYSPNDGNNSIGHNTHILNDYAVTSWYTDGFTIVDAHKPDNLVLVGMYDTWPQAGGPDFDGCWGVYPFLPSGNQLVTNIPNTNGGTGKLFVFTPTFKRAAYLEGQLFDNCTGQPLAGAKIEITGGTAIPASYSDNNGLIKTGFPEYGAVTITISKPGYISQTKNVTLTAGEVTDLNATLERTSAFTVAGKLFNKNNGASLANTAFSLKGATETYSLTTNSSGQFDLSCVPGGAYRVGAWGYLVDDLMISGDGNVNISLQPAYYDDYELNLGWSASGTASSGFWTIGEPVGTFQGGSAVNPDFDVNTDHGDQCYVTGNGGGGIGNDDVDNGAVTLTSPVMRLAATPDPVLTFFYWFVNTGGSGTPNDRMEVKVGNGTQTVTIQTVNTSENQWRYSGEIHLKDFLTITDNMRVQYIAYDDNPGHVVEAAVDVFQVTPGVVSAFEPDPSAQILLSPNPTATDFQLQYNWPNVQNSTLEVRNLLGQLVSSQQLKAENGILRFGAQLPRGVYLVSLRTADRQSVVLKAVKQ